jgi:putative endonuclease
MYYVYVLKSDKDGRFYKGMTRNISKRLIQHNNGENKSTKGFRPWRLVFKKQFETRMEAREFEKYLKSGIGREFLKKIK